MAKHQHGAELWDCMPACAGPITVAFNFQRVVSLPPLELLFLLPIPPFVFHPFTLSSRCTGKLCLPPPTLISSFVHFSSLLL